MNTNYDFAADAKLNNCIICVQETSKVFKWQVGVLTAKKKGGKNIIFTFFKPNLIMVDFE